MTQNQNHQVRLQQVLGFTDADYEANSQGQLTTKQIQHLDKLLSKALSDLRKIQIGLPIGAFLVVFVLPQLIFSSMPVRMELDFTSKGFLIGGSIALAIGIQYLINKQKRLDPSTKDRVSILDSFVYLRTCFEIPVW